MYLAKAIPPSLIVSVFLQKPPTRAVYLPNWAIGRIAARPLIKYGYNLGLPRRKGKDRPGCWYYSNTVALIQEVSIVAMRSMSTAPRFLLYTQLSTVFTSAWP